MSQILHHFHLKETDNGDEFIAERAESFNPKKSTILVHFKQL